MIRNRDASLNIVGPDDDEGFSSKIALVNNRNQANARLIAASPEMANVLAWADAHADDQDMSHVDFRIELVTRARAALALAHARDGRCGGGQPRG